MSTDFATDNFDLDFSDTNDASDLEMGGGFVGPGIYHIGINKIELAPLGNDHHPIRNAFLKFEAEVIGGKPEKEIGRKLGKILWVPDRSLIGTDEEWKYKASNKLLNRFAKALLIVPANVYGVKVQNPPWLEGVGRHCVIELVAKKDSKTDTILKNVWHSASAEVREYVNAEFCREYDMGPDSMATGAGDGNSSGAPTSSQPKATVGGSTALDSI